MQLSPNENYPIFHGIINHTDTTTYYVQTKIYDSSHVLLDTVNLTDEGSQNFLKMWKVLYDNVFQRGRWILMVTSVYTDSGYTTKSTNYGDEFQTHLVQERWDMAKMASIGGGSEGIDYKKLTEIIKKQLDKVNPKENKELDVKKLTKDIAETVVKALPEPEKIEIPEQKETDLVPLETKMDKVGITIEKRVSNMEKILKKDSDKNTDMLLTKIQNESSGVVKLFKELFQQLTQIVINNKANIDVTTVKKAVRSGEREEVIRKLRRKHGV